MTPLGGIPRQNALMGRDGTRRALIWIDGEWADEHPDSAVPTSGAQLDAGPF